MKITFENYISIFIDYFEGKLSNEESIELMQFLSSHPELQNEFDQIQFLFLQPIEAEKLDFTYLLKDINQLNEVNQHNFEELCIAELEGDLNNPVLRGMLYQGINSSKANLKTFELYKQVKAIPDKKIIFPNKKFLKRREKAITQTWIYRSIAIAASITILIGMSIWFNTNTKKTAISISNPTPIENQRVLANQTISKERVIQSLPSDPDRPYKTIKKMQNESLSQIDTANHSPVKSFTQLEPLIPRQSYVMAYFPNREFIIVDENILKRSWEGDFKGVETLTVGQWMNDQLKRWKNTILNIPAEYSLSKVVETNFAQLSLQSKNHVIFRHSADTLYGRKQVEVNLGWVELYFSYSTGY
ncbi:MAG: hypothetical protein N2662_01895 [Bacteroidales bacterium]|nr:hypothetical protein [Bacteroidales bacterium]